MNCFIKILCPNTLLGSFFRFTQGTSPHQAPPHLQDTLHYQSPWPALLVATACHRHCLPPPPWQKIVGRHLALSVFHSRSRSTTIAYPRAFISFEIAAPPVTVAAVAIAGVANEDQTARTTHLLL